MIKFWKRNTRAGTPTGARPRPRVGSIWRNRWFAGVLVVILVGLSAGGGWWGWRTGAVERLVDQAKWRIIAVSADIGFRVNEVLVMGREETSRQALLKAVRLVRGAPILAFDLEAARQRVEALPWIRRATIERMLPDTVLVTVEERRPLALWQYEGQFALIDFHGEIILRKGLESYNNLLVVVGKGAAVHAASLLATLGVEPELMGLVKAAVWVGGRRWNLRLKGDIDVQLPEQDPEAAWRRLAEYEKTHQVLERDVQVLDLRIPDRLIVRKAPRKGKAAPSPGQET